MLNQKVIASSLLFFLSGVGLVTGSPRCFAETPLQTSIPSLEKRGQVTQLIVNGKPWLILGGELHNSSASSAEYMEPVMEHPVTLPL